VRIVIRARDARAARRAQEKLAEAGFEASALIGPRPGPEAEDVLILPDAEGEAATALSAASVRPLATLRAGVHAEAPPIGLAAAAGFDAAIALDAPSALLSRQLKNALRMGASEEERARRRLTAAELEAPPAACPPERPLRALYVGPPSSHFLWLERVVQEQGGVLVAAFSSYVGFDHLHDETFDAVILNGAADAPRALSLCAALRRNANLADLPTLFLIDPNDTESAGKAIARGAAAVAATEAEGVIALGWLCDAIRVTRRRHAAEHEGRGLRDLMGDPRTGLFTKAAFTTHLTRLADDHHATGRPLALAVLRVVQAPGARRPIERHWKKGFAEVSSLTARLMRDADSGAAIDSDTIVVAFPFTTLAKARRALRRITSVAECTAFAAGEDSGGAPLIFEQSVVELQPGESGSGLMARARAIFEAEIAHA
jgi:PleD family two-component response regulator